MEEIKEQTSKSSRSNDKNGNKKSFSPKILTACIVGAFCLVIVLAMIITMVTVKNSTIKADAKTNIEIEVSQVEREQNLLLKWDADKSIEQLDVVVKHNGNIYYSTSIRNSTVLASKKAELPISYGKYEVEVTPIRNGIKSQTKTATAKLYADEYVIAPLFATMPITYFTLQLDTITNNYTIPTFVWFSRGSSWDYSEMPENVYVVPVANGKEITGQNDIHKIFNKTSAWIKELYEINSESKFHLYYNDILGTGVLDATVGNGIPTSAYDVVLITDGAGTYYSFNNYFANAEDTSIVYNNMVATYNKLKQEIKDYGYYNTYSREYAVNDEQFWGYAYVMTKEEPNVSWWINRYSGTMASNMQDDLKELQTAGKLSTLNMANLMPTDDEGKEKLKKLYKFGDNYFSEAIKQNKKALVILGGSTQSEYYFVDYVNAMKKYYGDEYIYYYKGHPKTPTDLDENKKKTLNDLGLIDIDSSIAAEIILLFNPDVYVSGYKSSTYMNVPAEQCCGLFNFDYNNNSDVAVNSYKDKFDYFVTPVSSDNETYGSLVSNTRSYVLQFVSNEKYDIAIYDAENDTMKFYKKSGETFSEVNK